MSDERERLAAFEQRAAEFYADTGLLAPGKDYPAAMPPTVDEVTRLREWGAWLAGRKRGQAERPALDETVELRRVLAAWHGCPAAGLYLDDGECQCGHFAPPIDFLREPVDTLVTLMRRHAEQCRARERPALPPVSDLDIAAGVEAYRCAVGDPPYTEDMLEEIAAIVRAVLGSGPVTAPALPPVQRWSLRAVDGPEGEPCYDGMETDDEGEWVRYASIAVDAAPPTPAEPQVIDLMAALKVGLHKTAREQLVALVADVPSGSAHVTVPLAVARTLTTLPPVDAAPVAPTQSVVQAATALRDFLAQEWSQCGAEGDVYPHGALRARVEALERALVGAPVAPRERLMVKAICQHCRRVTIVGWHDELDARSVAPDKETP